MSMTTNPREKHPGTQRQYLDLKTSTTVHTGTETAVIAAPPAGYCVNIWGVFGIAGGADIAGWDITDGANGTVTVACNKYTSMNITFPMPIKCAEATALNITDAHTIIQETAKVSVVYYTIVPV